MQIQKCSGKNIRILCVAGEYQGGKFEIIQDEKNLLKSVIG